MAQRGEPRHESSGEREPATPDALTADVDSTRPLTTPVPIASDPTIADQLGEAAGGISGVLVGMGLGGAAGPAGAVIGGLAGALGGWWTGRTVAEAAGRLTRDDDEHYRKHFAAAGPEARAYDELRAAYYLGQIASQNPNFTSRMFHEVEPELRDGWTRQPEPPGQWEEVRDFVRTGFERGVERRSWSERRLTQRSPDEDTDRREGLERRTPEW